MATIWGQRDGRRGESEEGGMTPCAPLSVLFGTAITIDPADRGLMRLLAESPRFTESLVILWQEVAAIWAVPGMLALTGPGVGDDDPLLIVAVRPPDDRPDALDDLALFLASPVWRAMCAQVPLAVDTTVVPLTRRSRRLCP